MRSTDIALEPGRFVPSIRPHLSRQTFDSVCPFEVSEFENQDLVDLAFFVMMEPLFMLRVGRSFYYQVVTIL
jgi:hypothetical protein